MLRRLLNIASIVCLVLCVALMGLWVRSYYRIDRLNIHVSSILIEITAIQGRLCFGFASNPYGPWHWEWMSVRMHDFPSPPWQIFGFSVVQNSVWTTYYLPYWSTVLVSGSLGMILRARSAWRFNLRTLFVVTTFLAVMLGMIAWLDRAWIGK